MSDKLPQISGERMARVLVKLGFTLAHQRGSHMKFTRTSQKTVEIIIVYAHYTLKKGSLARMLTRLDLTVEKFKSLL